MTTNNQSRNDKGRGPRPDLSWPTPELSDTVANLLHRDHNRRDTPTPKEGKRHV